MPKRLKTSHQDSTIGDNDMFKEKSRNFSAKMPKSRSSSKEFKELGSPTPSEKKIDTIPKFWLAMLVVISVGIFTAGSMNNFEILSFVGLRFNFINYWSVQQNIIDVARSQGVHDKGLEDDHSSWNDKSHSGMELEFQRGHMPLLGEHATNLRHLSCSGKLESSCGKVDKREKLSLKEFHEVYDGKWPVIVTDVMSSWPATNWTADFFKTKYGKARVTMTTYADSEKSGFSVPLKVFLDHLHLSTPKTWTYLQDEVFLIQHPERRTDVLKPIYTAEDLFQLLPTAVRPWDCMLLWGTAHSRSSLHIDPYNWTGTNAVIGGLKRWKRFRPV